MSLWRVEVAGVSHRYVDAEDAEAAVELVSEAITAELDLRAAPAAKVLAAEYEAAGPLKRRRLLVAMDGLISPTSRTSTKRTLAKLERLIRHQADVEAWARRTAPAAPPQPDPEIIDRLFRVSEVQRLERSLRRIKPHDRHEEPPHLSV